MKKVFLVFAVALLALCVSSCSKSDGDNGYGNKTNTNDTEIPINKKMIGRMFSRQSFKGYSKAGYREIDTTRYMIYDENYIKTWIDSKIIGVETIGKPDTSMYRYTIKFPIIYIEKVNVEKMTFSSDTIKLIDSDGNEYLRTK
jgi:hypothetical protein